MLARAITLLVFSIVILQLFSTSMAAGSSFVDHADRVSPIETKESRNDYTVAPARFPFLNLVPGKESTQNWRIRNYSSMPITLDLNLLPLQGSSDARGLVETAPEFSIVEPQRWVTIDDKTFPLKLRLDAREGISIPVKVKVPADAPPGVYPIGMAASTHTSTSKDGAGVALTGSAASQLIIVATGMTDSSIDVKKVEARRFITSGKSGWFRARIKNTGNSILRLDGRVILKSFGIWDAKQLDTKPIDTLPNGERVVELRWNDPPIAGFYRPELTVVGGANTGIRYDTEMPMVFVIPPWWLIVLIGMPIAALLILRQLRRQ